MPFGSRTSSTVIKQDITENNMNTEMLKQTQLLADNHTELKFSLCSLYVFQDFENQYIQNKSNSKNV